MKTVADACPTVKETYNQFQDEDGCPDNVDSINPQYTFPDTDGDGIEDRWDSCIDEPENYNDYMTVAQTLLVQQLETCLMLIMMDLQII
jgi:hypothetical protein